MLLHFLVNLFIVFLMVVNQDRIEGTTTLGNAGEGGGGGGGGEGRWLCALFEN